jgi:peptidyl-prolyl cis-trans isomerase C
MKALIPLRYPYGIALRILAAVILTPALVIGLSVFVAVRATALPDDAVLRADGVVVTEFDLRHRLDLLRALYGIEAPTEPARLDVFRRGAEQAVAMSVVFDRAARDEGVVVPDEVVRRGLDDLVQARFPAGRAGFVALLGQVGASEQDVLDEIRRQRETRQLYDKVVAGRAGETTVSEPEARRWFDEHPESFVEPETRRIRNIVVSREEQAGQVAAEARAGADFAALVTRYSIDGATRDSGGDLGAVTRARLDEEFGTAAFTAPPGGVFGPVRTGDNWNVGQVVEITPSYPVRYESISDQLRLDLEKQKSGEIWRAWVADRVRDAGVEYAERYRPLDPATGTATPSGPVPGPPPVEKGASR